MATTARQYEDMSIEEIETALSYVPAHDRDVWVKMAMAVKSALGESGFDIWDRWSQTSGNYKAPDAKSTWKSVKQKGKLKIETLFYIAMDNGYKLNDNAKRLSDEEFRARQEHRQREIEAEKIRTKQRHERAAKDAVAIYESAKVEGLEQHPYALKKSMRVFGKARVGTYKRWFNGEVREFENTLFVPIYDENRAIVSLQAYFAKNELISEDNPEGQDRDYMPGGRKSGCYHLIGSTPKEPTVFIVCEGFSTGAAIHQATGYPVMVAFDSGNLDDIGKLVRARLPDVRIFFAADDDRYKPQTGNPGIKQATKAAASVGGIVVSPRFKSLDGEPTDFDDLARREGEETVRAQIEAAITGNCSVASLPPVIANDNAAQSSPAEQALADFLQVYGIDNEGHLHFRDMRAGRNRSHKMDRMCSKAILLDLAPASAWDVAIALDDPTRTKFTVDAAYGLLTTIAKAKPPYTSRNNPDTLTGKHGADSAIIANLMREHTLFDEYSQSWYNWDTIWRPMTEGDVKRKLTQALDAAFGMQYDSNSFTGTFSLLKIRLGRAPQMSSDGNSTLDAWSNDKNLLPMLNGVLNIETHELLPHSPSMMSNWMIPHNYDPNAKCPTIHQFIHDLAHGDQSTMAVLFTYMAAILYGRSDIQKYLECVGVPGTGKSTYINLCKELVGMQNVAITTMEQLNKSQFETANIYGKRLVVISDADKYGGSVDVFKAITGQDPIRFEEKFKQAGKPFIFGGMVLVAANQPVQFNDTSTAMVRRRIPVHIDKRLDATKVDLNLQKKLSAEIPGLINTLLGLERSQITDVLRDKAKIRADAENRALCETNPVADWLNNMVVADPYSMAKIGTLKHDASECLYPSYEQYCHKVGRRGVITLQSFSKGIIEILSHAGVKAEKHTNKHGAHIKGIRLRGQYDDGLPPPLYGDKPENFFRV